MDETKKFSTANTDPHVVRELAYIKTEISAATEAVVNAVYFVGFFIVLAIMFHGCVQ